MLAQALNNERCGVGRGGFPTLEPVAPDELVRFPGDAGVPPHTARSGPAHHNRNFLLQAKLVQQPPGHPRAAPSVAVVHDQAQYLELGTGEQQGHGVGVVHVAGKVAIEKDLLFGSGESGEAEGEAKKRRKHEGGRTWNP